MSVRTPKRSGLGRPRTSRRAGSAAACPLGCTSRRITGARRCHSEEDLPCEQDECSRDVNPLAKNAITGVDAPLASMRLTRMTSSPPKAGCRGSSRRRRAGRCRWRDGLDAGAVAGGGARSRIPVSSCPPSGTRGMSSLEPSRVRGSPIMEERSVSPLGQVMRAFREPARHVGGVAVPHPCARTGTRARRSRGRRCRARPFGRAAPGERCAGRTQRVRVIVVLRPSKIDDAGACSRPGCSTRQAPAREVASTWKVFSGRIRRQLGHRGVRPRGSARRAESDMNGQPQCGSTVGSATLGWRNRGRYEGTRQPFLDQWIRAGSCGHPSKWPSTHPTPASGQLEPRWFGLPGDGLSARGRARGIRFVLSVPSSRCLWAAALLLLGDP